MEFEWATSVRFLTKRSILKIHSDLCLKPGVLSLQGGSQRIFLEGDYDDAYCGWND